MEAVAPVARTLRFGVPWRSALTLAAVGLVAVRGSGDVSWQASLAVLVFAVVGLPHGALDHLVGRDRLGVGLVPFHFFYVAMALAIGGLWLVAPEAVGLLFLGLSAWHFGEGDIRGLGTRWPSLLILSRGLLVVGMLLWAWPPIVVETLGPWAFLAGYVDRSPWLLTALWGQHALALVVFVREPAAERLRLVFESGILAVWMWLAEPLLAFTLYFGLWHSLDHLVVLQRTLGRRSAWTLAATLARGFPYTLVSMLGIIVFAILASEALPAATIWTGALGGLAAVATPHLVLVEWWRMRERAWTRA